MMADGGTDQGVMEEVLVYVRYLDMELGKPPDIFHIQLRLG